MSWLRKPAIFSSSSWTGHHHHHHQLQQQQQLHSPSNSKVTTTTTANDSVTTSTNLQAAISPSTANTNLAISSSNEVTPTVGLITPNCTFDGEHVTPESTKNVSSSATNIVSTADGGSSNATFSSTGVSLRRDTNHHTATFQQQLTSTMSFLPSASSSFAATGSSFLSGFRKSTMLTNTLSKTSNLIDSQAALDSFRTHWFQAWDIMRRKCVPPGSTSSTTIKPNFSSNIEVTESDLPSNGLQVGQNGENTSRESSLNFHNPTSHKSVITSDDVTSIINHLDQMIQLLVQESKGLTSTSNPSRSLNEPSQMVPPECDSILTIDTGNTDPLISHSMVSPLLDCLLFESMLDKLLTWSVGAGEFTSIMKLHQLRLYHILVTQICPTKALLTKPIIRPMMQLLVTCSDCLPVEVEKAFVTLLNALCQLLCQNDHLIDLFFIDDPEKNSQVVPNLESSLENSCDGKSNRSPSTSSHVGSSSSSSSTCDPNGTNNQHHLSYLSPTIKPSDDSSPQVRAKIAWISDKPEARFLLFSLLIPYVHREGLIGSEARNGLLALLSLSKKFESIAQYIADQSNFCPVLATGLSGLYSSLPRKIQAISVDPEWHQITSNDINESPELRQFLSSLDFCDAVVSVSAKSIQKQLIEFILHGFLISVIAPALHQVSTLCHG